MQMLQFEVWIRAEKPLIMSLRRRAEDAVGTDAPEGWLTFFTSLLAEQERPWGEGENGRYTDQLEPLRATDPLIEMYGEYYPGDGFRLRLKFEGSDAVNLLLNYVAEQVPDLRAVFVHCVEPEAAVAYEWRWVYGESKGVSSYEWRPGSYIPQS